MLASTARLRDDLPDVDEAVSHGEVGFDRAVADCRFASRDDVFDILDETAGYDIAGIRHRAARRRRLAPIDEQFAFEDRSVSIQPNLDESAWSLTGRLLGCAGRTVIDALEQKADQFPYGPTATPSRPTRHADALWEISEESLHGDDDAMLEASGPIVTVFVDTTEAATTNGETGITIEAGPRVGRHTLEAVLCDGIVEVTARSQDGTPFAMGRRSGVIPPRLRRFVMHRDGGVCTTTGCVSRYRLQADHMVPWSKGDPATQPE